MATDTGTALTPAQSEADIRAGVLQKVAPYLYLAPAAFVLLLFLLGPLGYACYLSLTAYNGLTPPQWVGLANYGHLLHDSIFWKSLANTVIFLLGVVPALVMVSLLLAVLVNRAIWGIGLFRVAFYMPVVISMVAAGLMWKWIFAENGLLNYGLSFMLPALAEAPIPWLARPETALAAVMVVTVWKGLGYYMVIYLAGLQTIPGEIYESAALDGASAWQQTVRITIPMMWPSITFVAIVSSISALKSFTEMYVMTKGGPLDASTTVVYYLYQQSFDYLNMGYANAVGMVLFVLILAFSVLNMRAFENSSPQG